MPQPTAGDVFVSAPLTTVSLNFFQSQEDFIADKMFPVVPVNLQAGIVLEWDLEYILKNGMKPRAEGAESEGIGQKLNPRNYACIVEALHIDISDQRRANMVSVLPDGTVVAGPLDADRNATTTLTSQATQRREITLKSKAFGTGKWTGMPDQAGVAGAPGANQFKQWNDPASDPVGDVTRWRKTMKLATGIDPTRLSMGRDAWDALSTNAAILDRLKFFGVPGSPTEVTQAAVAALFKVKSLLVSSVVQMTSAEGATTANQVKSFVVGKELLLYSAPDAPGLDMPSAGYTFGWVGMSGMNSYGARVKKIRIEQRESDRIEIQQAYDQTPMSTPLGGYASAVVA